MSMPPRLHVRPDCLRDDGQPFSLEDGPSRHIQVLRLQPGDAVRLFDGQGSEWTAEVTDMGRKLVQVSLGEPLANDRELPVRVTLAVGMPANDRMDAVVEKATELGVHAIQPLVCARSVLRLDGERAAKKVAHWRAVAVSASEQCGRAVVPQVRPVQGLAGWLKGDQSATVADHRGVLSLREATGVRQWLAAQGGRVGCGGVGLGVGVSEAVRGASWCFLNGPEGGLAPEEEALALAQGWTAISLGPRVLRADTAPLAVLSVIASVFEG